MSGRGRFEFFDEWRLAAGSDAVWAVVRDVEGWPDWWPSVRSVTPFPERTVPTWEFRFHTRLPYDMAFAAELVRDNRLLRAEAQVTGRVDGSGLCVATAIDGGTLVRFDWWVRPQLAWMRAVAPAGHPPADRPGRSPAARPRRIPPHLARSPPGLTAFCVM